MEAWLPAPIRSEPGAESQLALRVEMLDLTAAAAHRDAWADLARRAVAPDIFHDPLFMLPAAERFPPASRPAFLLAWNSDGDEPTLVGFCAVRLSRFAFGGRAARAWLHEQAVTAAPLLDEARAVETLTAMLDWLARSGHAGLLCRGVPLDGPLGCVLTAPALHHAIVGARSRAVLTRAGDPARGRRAKEWRRQARRLVDRGSLATRSARGPDEVRDALDEFLALEAAGWKGRRGTALAQNPGLTRFVRRATADLAGENRCHIDSLELDGRPVAMGILLRSRDRAYYWKTTFEEAHATLSPGRQFTQALTGRLLLDPDVSLTDSCAMPDHPMIDRLWPERMMVADVLVGSASRSRRARALDRAAAILRARAAGRATLKAGHKVTAAWIRGLAAKFRRAWP